VTKSPRVFVASLATETNTFSPLRCDFMDFTDSFYAPPGEHPDTPTLCSAVFNCLRKRQSAGEIQLIEGTATWAEPGGLVNSNTWLKLHDEILDQLKTALPVQAVLLGLHGAMIAEGCLDCEGVLIEAVRDIVGPNVAIGVTFDPHCHLSEKRLRNADIITIFKEFPHTDFVETAEACVDLTMRLMRREIVPTTAVFDVCMIDVLPTSMQPMRGFVDKMLAIEADETELSTVLSISLVHGFLAGDNPDLGAKVVVITNNQQLQANQIAKSLGMEVFSFRGAAKPDFIDPKLALTEAKAATKFPVVIADVWDNPGGGTAGDSTILSILALKSGIESIAIAPLWDPMAVRLCFAAGEGAVMDLRFGGKTSAHAGAPIDSEVEVVKLQRSAQQSFGSSIVPLGDSAVIRIGSVDIVLTSNRAQAFSPDIFSNLGIDPSAKRLLLVKSTNHFYDAFSKISQHIIYAAVEGPYPNDARLTDYKQLKRDIWPRVENPHIEPRLKPAMSRTDRSSLKDS
jgi:microcystin degradation protein MlrC